jgi:Cu/Ag efflux protein CusF
VKLISPVLRWLQWFEASRLAPQGGRTLTESFDMKFTSIVFSPLLAVALTANALSVFATDMTAGVIKRVDAANGKLTIKHEDIKNLDMPGMTMVFTLHDKAAASQFAKGDAVKFAVEMQGQTMVITAIERAP